MAQSLKFHLLPTFSNYSLNVLFNLIDGIDCSALPHVIFNSVEFTLIKGFKSALKLAFFRA
ncbi:hypothetical protein NIES4103_60190 [Nostoc sp. NIES-4103]|nr:hypothetical protein NIES4103_60190 [Nostoc sp. NIES-4103]